jgi:hypothetical protein
MPFPHDPLLPLVTRLLGLGRLARGVEAKPTIFFVDLAPSALAYYKNSFRLGG